VSAADYAGFIAVVCAVVTLLLQVRKQVAEQNAARVAAAATLRRKTLREGYRKRTAEVRPVIDRALDLLINDAMGHSPVADRALNRAITILTEARDGAPDDADDDSGT
jgi:hypothetical protein